jgi:hypothetical protein
LYRNGYEKALEVSLRVTRAAAQRFELIERTKRIDGRKVHPHEPLGAPRTPGRATRQRRGRS